MSLKQRREKLTELFRKEEQQYAEAIRVSFISKISVFKAGEQGRAGGQLLLKKIRSPTGGKIYRPFCPTGI